MITYSEFIAAKKIVFKTKKQFVFDMFMKDLKRYKTQLSYVSK